MRLPKLPPLSSPLVPFLLGLLLASFGAFLAYPPAGFIVPGVVLMYVALFGDKQA